MRWPLLASALLFVAPIARAEEATRIVLVTNHADAAIVPQLRAELELLGLTVVEMDHGPNEVIPRDLTKAARSTEAVAGFRVVVAEGKVEVWISDRVTGKVTLREILAQDGNKASETAAVVLRAVELLRISLMELESPTEPQGEIEAPAGLDDVVGFPGSKGLFGVDAGAGAMWASPEIGVTPTLRFALRYRFLDNWHATAFGTLSLGASTLVEPEGTADIQSMLFGASVRWGPAKPNATWQPLLGVGGGVHLVSGQGNVDPPLNEFSYTGVSPVVLGHATLQYRIVNNFRLWAGIDAGASLAPVVLQFGDRPVASYSYFLGQAALGVEVAVP